MATKRRAVVVVCDSLRPDLITPDVAPTLATMRESATSFERAAAIFPSVTRVSAASLATGCHPASHGLCGNTVALDEGNGLACLSVGDSGFRARLRRVTGRTLLRPTLAERLAGHGGVIAMSNVSPGAAYFLDPDSFGYVYHRAGSFAPGGMPIVDAPLAITIGEAGDAAMTARFCGEVLRERRPAVGILWLSEPDHTGHGAVLGSPEHRRAITAADACVRRVREAVEALSARGEDVLLVVCSDHGMETTLETIDLGALLVDAGLKTARDSSDVVVAPNGTAALIFVAEPSRDRVGAIEALLRRQDWIAEVHANEGLAALGLPTGTSLALAIATRVRPLPNAYGVIGCASIVADPAEKKDYTGRGQHGGTGEHETRPFLFVLGGGFSAGRRSDAVSIVDIAPTVLRHLGRPLNGMDGSPLPLA
jgi:predicted AlkP superfamily pyrophosphatase or phosphodiesterase